jgi:hypothetical protein
MADHTAEADDPAHGTGVTPALKSTDNEAEPRRLRLALAAALAGGEDRRPAVELLGGHDTTTQPPLDELAPERLVDIVRALMGELEAIAKRIGYAAAAVAPGDHITVSSALEDTLTIYECHAAIAGDGGGALVSIAAIRELATNQRLTPWDALEQIRLVLAT